MLENITKIIEIINKIDYLSSRFSSIINKILGKRNDTDFKPTPLGNHTLSENKRFNPKLLLGVLAVLGALASLSFIKTDSEAFAEDFLKLERFATEQDENKCNFILDQQIKKHNLDLRNKNKPITIQGGVIFVKNIQPGKILNETIKTTTIKPTLENLTNFKTPYNYVIREDTSITQMIRYIANNHDSKSEGNLYKKFISNKQPHNFIEIADLKLHKSSKSFYDGIQLSKIFKIELEPDILKNREALKSKKILFPLGIESYIVFQNIIHKDKGNPVISSYIVNENSLPVWIQLVYNDIALIYYDETIKDCFYRFKTFQENPSIYKPYQVFYTNP